MGSDLQEAREIQSACEQVEAFKYLESGSHIGKIVIEVVKN